MVTVAKVQHHDPNKNKPANTKTSDVKGILAEAATSANMSNNGKGMSFKKQSMGRLLDDNGNVVKVSRNNAAYKQNKALGQSIQGNVEKEGDGGMSTTGTEGMSNPVYGKDIVKPKKQFKKEHQQM